MIKSETVTTEVKDKFKGARALDRAWLWILVPALALLWNPVRWGLVSWTSPGSPLFFQLFVPFGAAYLAWTRRDDWRRTTAELSELFPDPTSPKRVGNLFFVFAGAGLLLLAFLTAMPPLGIGALWLLLLGGIFYLYGPFLLRVVLAPLGFLLLAVPLPAGTLSRLVNGFQGVAASVTGQALTLFGVKVRILWGALTLLSSGYRLEITPSYTGLGVFFFVMVTSLLLILLRRPPVWKALIYLSLTAGITCVASILRIVLLALVARSNPLLATSFYEIPALPTILVALGLSYGVGGRLLKPQVREELVV